MLGIRLPAVTGFVVLLPLAIAVPARASGDLEAAQELFRQVEYARAIEALQRALRGPLSREQRVGALVLLAKAYRALGRPADAIAAFRTLLQIAPRHRLSPEREPPSLIELFERARREVARAAKPRPPRISHEPLRVGHAERGVIVEAKIAHRRPDHRARLFFRRIGQLRYQSVELAPREGDRFVGELPRSFLEGRRSDYLVEYYLVVVDAVGEVLDRVGSEDRPLTFRVIAAAPLQAPPTPPATRPSWHRRYWWVWVAVGVVVVGGAVGAGVAAR